MSNLCELDWDIISKFFSTIVSALTALYVFIFSIKYQEANKTIAEEKMEKELFKEFNERYDKLNENILNSRKLEKIEEENEEHNKIKKSIIDYFNLCAEEYFWRKKERISGAIWDSWQAGMKMNYLKSKVIQKLWEEECEDEGFKSYYLNSPKELFE